MIRVVSTITVIIFIGFRLSGGFSTNQIDQVRYRVHHCNVSYLNRCMGDTNRDASKSASGDTEETESTEDISIGLAGRRVLNRFGRFSQLVGTTLLRSQQNLWVTT